MELGERHKLQRDVQNVIEVINQLSNIHRYSRDHMMKPENTLEHTGFVVLFGYFIGMKMRGRGHEIDMAKLMIRLAIHDIEEGLTGDVTRTTKYDNPVILAEMKRLELKAATHLSNFLDVDFMGHWLNAKDGSMEGIIAKISDMAAVVYKTMVEVNMYGNRGFLRVSQEVEEEIDLMLVKFSHTNTEFLWVVQELKGILDRAKDGSLQTGSFFHNFGMERE